MTAREIVDGVHWVGAIDWDRRLFDELIPLPEGTSYNAYIVIGKDRSALIDTVDPAMEHELMAHLDALGVQKLDYVVCNHAEQDHSGSIPAVLERYPEAVVVTNLKCRDMLTTHLHVPEHRIQVIEDGCTLDLGGRTLEFIIAPWVHWPETMLTYLREDRILFPCDLFGSHLATSDLYVDDWTAVRDGAKRYYAEIMMPFRVRIRDHLKRVRELDPLMIAPSHGPVYDDPGHIMEAYEDWISDHVDPEVVVAYVSMHGSTAVMVDHLVDALMARGIRVKQFDLTVSDIGELAMHLVDASTLVLGTPTVLAGPHPVAAQAAFLVNALRPKLRYVALVGSYGWGGRTVEIVAGMLPNLKAEILEPVLVKGLPTEHELVDLTALADAIAERQKGLS